MPAKVRKLYLITGTKLDYDTFDSAVVCAVSSRTARQTHPSGRIVVNWKKDGTWVNSPDDVEVQYLGVASRRIGLGVVCASFNAG